MTHAIRIRSFGGPEVLEWAEVELGDPAPHEARVAHRAIGLNFIDTYHRTGLYPVELPSGLGSEAAGIVTAVGAKVGHVRPGDRVAYVCPAPVDGCSEERLIDARWLVKVPSSIADETAAAVFLKGMTAWYLLTGSYRVRAGDWVLLHAAAGGVGLLTSQWAKHLGARVIGVVGTEEKRQLALAHGCEKVLLAADDIVAEVRGLTGGEGVPVVYDSVGRDTFFLSLDCLRRRGMMVSFGNASGPVAPFAPAELAKRGSLSLTRPRLFDFIATREELEGAAAGLFDLVGRGIVKVEIRQRYPLGEAARAHRDLEARRTTGSTVLVP